MSDGFRLDTHIVSELTRTRIEPKVQSWVAAQQLGSLSISVVSIGEMEKGFTMMSDRPRRSRLETWLEVQLIETVSRPGTTCDPRGCEALGAI